MHGADYVRNKAMFTEKMSEKYEICRKKSAHNQYPQTRYTSAAVDRGSCTGGAGHMLAYTSLMGRV